MGNSTLDCEHVSNLRPFDIHRVRCKRPIRYFTFMYSVTVLYVAL